MRTRVESLRFGDQEVLVSAIISAGTEKTGLSDQAREKAADALDKARDTIDAVARSTLDTITRLKDKGTCPDAVEVELGLAFTISGNVVVAGGEVAASIVVHLSYDTSR